MMTAHAETLRSTNGGDTVTRVDGLLRSCRDALAAVDGAVATLDRQTLGKPPTSWHELVAGFRDAGLLIEADAELTAIRLDDERGRCLYRVVHEGLTNALRHADRGCAVRIGVEMGPDSISVRITNDRRPDRPPYRPVGGGFGLLSLEQDVVALAGAIDYGEIPEGWTLYARLPDIAGPASIAEAAHGVQAASGPIPIVVVDDEAMIRQGLRLLLGCHPDMEVIAEFAGGAALLDFLRSRAKVVSAGRGAPEYASAECRPRPLVVLLDLVMPEVDGLAALAAIRAYSGPARPQVLVLTTYGDEVAVRRALALGACGYILKGGTAHQLATAIRAVAGGLTALSPGIASVVPVGPVPAGVSGVHRPAATADPGQRGLTPREVEVLDLLGHGLSNRAIARQLGLSERTVKIHVSAVLAKLGVESRTQAALQARGQS
jgi:DNA-binding NarL/FixJ family response regulator